MESSLTLCPLSRWEYLSEPAQDGLTRDRTGIDQPYDTVDINEHRRRHTPERVALAHLALVIEQHGKGHVELAGELPGVRHAFLITQVDREDLQVLILVSVVRGDDVGHLAATRLAPGGPEVEKHGTTRVIGQTRRAAGERFQREVGRGRPQRLGRERTCGGENRRARDGEELRTEPHLGPPKRNAPSSRLGSSASAALPRTRLLQHGARSLARQAAAVHSVAVDPAGPPVNFQPRDEPARSHDHPGRPRFVAGASAYGGRSARAGPRHRRSRPHRHPAARRRARRTDRQADREGRGRARAPRRPRHHPVPRRPPDRRAQARHRRDPHPRRSRRQARGDRGRRAVHRPHGARRARRARRLRPAQTHLAVRAGGPGWAGAADPAGHRGETGEDEQRRAGGRAGRGARWARRSGRRAHRRVRVTALGKDLIGLEHLSADQIRLILDTAEPFKEVSERPIKKVPALRGKTIVNLFFESSTRTRISFEFAEKRLSADTVNVAASGSSVQKGETLVDTARNLEAMRIDMVVIRHPSSGAAGFLGDRIRSNVINAGDGKHEHPTQGLLDLLTIRDKHGKIEGLKVCLVGDILHSRVARSNIWGLSKLGAEVGVCGPDTLMPRGIEELGVCRFRRIEEAIEWADVLNVLRLQLERMEKGFIPSLREYYRVFGVTLERLDRAPRELTIMHPGPMNRGVEIDSRVADGAHSVILAQVTNGVAVRMAVLYLLAGGRPELAEAAKGPAGGGPE